MAPNVVSTSANSAAAQDHPARLADTALRTEIVQAGLYAVLWSANWVAVGWMVVVMRIMTVMGGVIIMLQ